MVSTGTLSVSQDLIDVLQPIVDDAVDLEAQTGSLHCQPSNIQQPDSMFDFPSLLQRFWRPFGTLREMELPTLHPIVRLVQKELLALPPFTTMTAAALSQTSVALSLPSWLFNSEIACHIAEAASRTFGTHVSIEAPPSAAFTAAGYELCRISYDAFECDGPGRIMILEYDNDVIVASVVRTPLLNWAETPVTYSVQRGLNVKAMTEWINSFIDQHRPDHMMIAGSNVKDSAFAEAVAHSHTDALLRDRSSTLPPGHVVAFGAALTAKINLESQIDDCSEPDECAQIRRKADAIAGTPTLPQPSVWPAVWSAPTPEHEEL